MTWINETDSLRGDFKELEHKMDRRFAQVDARFDRIDSRLDRIDARLEQVDARFERVDRRFDELREGIKADLLPGLRAEIATANSQLRADVMRWAFLYWIGAVVALAGVLRT